MKLKIELKSSMLPGSGSGVGAIINNDVVLDDMGLPYIPAKRIKGCLKDSALEVLEMCSLNNEARDILNFEEKHINDLFGTPGNQKKSPITLSNLFIEDYNDTIQWLQYLLAEENNIISKEKIKKQFTELRTTTAIDSDTGVAKKHSLRTSRYLRKGLVFEGFLNLDVSSNKERQKIREDILGFACANFKTMGTGRNRGTGDIECTLWDLKKIQPDILKDMEVQE